MIAGMLPEFSDSVDGLPLSGVLECDLDSSCWGVLRTAGHDIEQLVDNPRTFSFGTCYARSHRKKGRYLLRGSEDVAFCLANGFSVQIRNLERILPLESALVLFARRTAKDCGKPLDSLSAFITPPKEQALKPHADRTDIMTVQLSGRKTWSIYSSDVPSTALRTVDLRPGRSLFVPAGVWHAARASEQQSVSVGIVLAAI